MSMSVSRSKGTRNLSREQSLLRVPGSSAADKLILASLPDELLTLIVAELDLKDLMTIRRVCRSLRTASSSRVAWRSVYLRCLGESLPRPFFLPKPIKECSAEEIEYSLRRWHSEWPPAGVMHQVKRSIVNGPPKSYAHPHSMVVTPGGRWVLTGYADGSVWCFDLSDNLASTADVEPFLLLSPTHTGVSVSKPNVQVHIAIDYASDEAAGRASETHHLTRFNMAVVTCPFDYRLTGAYTHIDIWRVHLPGDKEIAHTETPQLVLGDHLSSFKDSGSGKLLSCSLYEKVVAYSMKSPSKCTVIVEWTEANGKNEDQGAQRWYIPEKTSMNILLLPGDRILTTHMAGTICLYNWRLDCPSSTLSPANQELEYVPPPWARGELENICDGAIPPFFIARNTIRLLVPTANELFALTIPKEGHDPSMITFESLVEGYSGVLDLTLGFGYDRGAGVVCEGSDILFFTRYRWRGDSPLLIEERHRHESTFTEYDVTDPDLQNAGRVLYDQFSNRFFVFDDSVSYVLTLVNSPPPKAPAHPVLPVTEPENRGETPTESESPAQVEPTEPPTPSDKPPTPIPNDSGSQSKEENPPLPTVPSGPAISEGGLPVPSKTVALPTIPESSAHAEEDTLTTSVSDPGAHLEPDPISGPCSGDRSTPDAVPSDHEEEEVEDESEAEKEVVDAVSIPDGAKEKDMEGGGGAEKDPEAADAVEREER
ncbi:hypothetical protein DFP72DRAFT_898703 [Ephemerocybe angulata]|uniref:F-box domain-containing protein n=1 Tax=Ephemerocybe angulata TaxID=980116 RepID=A0A8H6HXK5_9AGAR|nr:hypothetical protein DFP72DRAFT_898703 [Tulosesus angulatus]